MVIKASKHKGTNKDFKIYVRRSMTVHNLSFFYFLCTVNTESPNKKNHNKELSLLSPISEQS